VSTVQSLPSFEGFRVLSFESRRASEVESLIRTYGGRPVVVPALREVTLESNAAALDFVTRLLQDEFDITIFLTGVGTRELFTIAQQTHSRDAIVAALSRTKVVVRGPKPLAVLRELRVPQRSADGHYRLVLASAGDDDFEVHALATGPQAADALLRLEDLTLENAYARPQRLIASAVDVIVFIAGHGRARAIREIVAVHPGEDGGYRLRPQA